MATPETLTEVTEADDTDLFLSTTRSTRCARPRSRTC
jgi:hypothetical protein